MTKERNDGRDARRARFEYITLQTKRSNILYCESCSVSQRLYPTMAGKKRLKGSCNKFSTYYVQT